MLQVHEAALAALDRAKHAHQAAQAALQQPCFLQQPYWCDGAGTTATALEAWVKAGLPLRAVVHIKASQEGQQTKDAPLLIAGMATLLTASSGGLWHVVDSLQVLTTQVLCQHS